MVSPTNSNMPLASACTSRVSAPSLPVSRARPASSRHGCACGVRSPPRHRTLGTGSSASRRCGGGRAGAHGGGVRTAAPAERRRAWQRRQLERGAGVAAAQSSPPRSEATDEIRALTRERTTENLRDLGCWPAKTCGGGTLVFLCSWQDVGGATCGGGG